MRSSNDRLYGTVCETSIRFSWALVAQKIMSKKGGSIVRRDLLRALRCDEATLRRLIKSLLIAEEIESPEIVDGKVTYTLSK